VEQPETVKEVGQMKISLNKALKKGSLVLCILVAMFVVIGLELPESVHVEREIVIVASPETVFRLVNDLNESIKWSPWFDQDPGIEFKFEGPATGKGARMVWVSEKAEVGSGSQEIIVSRPSRKVIANLDFGGRGTALSTMTIAPYGNGCRVNWAFDTRFGYDPLKRYSGLFVDERIEREYKHGLTRLKLIAERQTM